MQQVRLALDARGDLTLGPKAAPPVLLHGVKSVELAYWGASPTDPEPAWHAAWSRMQNPPELVRVRLAFADGDRRIWPELIVRPAVQVNADCIFDAETGACRGQS